MLDPAFMQMWQNIARDSYTLLSLTTNRIKLSSQNIFLNNKILSIKVTPKKQKNLLLKFTVRDFIRY